MPTPILSGRPSQLAFDAILRSLAEPGTVRQLPPAPNADVPAVALIALALGDIDLGVAVDNDPGHPVARTLRSATGLDIVEQSGAHFVVCTDGAVPVGQMRAGTSLVPEDGARLAIAVGDLVPDGDLVADGDLDAVTLTGPGVPGERRLGVVGASVETLLRFGRASGEFPTGIDTWLVTPDGRIAAISRSTTVRRCHVGDTRGDN